MGTGLEKLIEGLEFLSPRQKVLVCQGAGIAVPGVYPFVFTDRGYQGQLDWQGICGVCRQQSQQVNSAFGVNVYFSAKCPGLP